MNNMTTLSYIIPLYNGSKTIVGCLDSIYVGGRLLDDFEVVVVDDCSTDDSVETVKRYALSHPNLRVIEHQVNKRQGGAKNTGIRAACGKYVVFADQDDAIVTESQAELLRIAKEQNADMISFQWQEIRNGELRLRFVRNGQESDFSGVGFCENVFDPADSLAPWSYLYRREYLIAQNHFFAENVMMEDADWIAWHLIHAARIHRVEMPIYQWIRNDQSITSSTSWRFKADFVLYGLRKIEDAKQYTAISSKFAQIMQEDGAFNIESSLRTLWKAEAYRPFYEKLGEEAMARLKRMHWSSWTGFVIRHPSATCSLLAIVGPILKTVRRIKRGQS